MSNKMIEFIVGFFDFNKDGETDMDDLGYVFSKFLSFITPIFKTYAKKGVSTILVPAAKAAVLAVATMSGDKKEAALDAIVENMAAQGIQLGMDAGMSTIEGIANHFSIDKSDVNLIIEREVAEAKMNGTID